MTTNSGSTIRTKSVTKGFAKTSPILLDETAATALAFLPQIHEGGVRGDLVRFKKNKDEKFEKLKEIDFRSLKLHEGVKIELGTSQLKKLIDEVSQREKIVEQNGVNYGKNKYKVVESSEGSLIVNDKNKIGVLNQILESDYSEDFWILLNESNPNLADKLSQGHLQCKRKSVIRGLKKRLDSDPGYHETIGGDSWQKWIYKNHWLFGVNYCKVTEKEKINIEGIMPDYLFLTTDGFLDVIEIKLPSMKVIERDPSHLGSWIWSKDSNKAIGQVVNYLNEIDRLQLEIERKINDKARRGNKDHKDYSILKPRSYILIGNSENWDMEQKQGLRKLNNALHGIEIITYHDLLQRGSLFIDSKS